MSDWHINARYIPYVLPAALVFLAIRPWPGRNAILAAAAVVTVAQATPMKLAYFDENSADHSTRLMSAAWIDANIPKQDGVCVSTPGPAPYSVPPFRLDHYRINSDDCRWTVRVERNSDSAPPIPGFTIAARFTPRLSPQSFPLVWENINPQISVYRLTR